MELSCTAPHTDNLGPCRLTEPDATDIDFEIFKFPAEDRFDPTLTKDSTDKELPKEPSSVIDKSLPNLTFVATEQRLASLAN